MSTPPAEPWTYHCEHDDCDYSIVVGARGGRGRDQGAGYEAAVMMERHVAERHAAVPPETPKDTP